MSYLAEFSQKARIAHQWTSFTPDVRGTQTINEHESQLMEDIEYFKINEVEEEVIYTYLSKYKQMFSRWLSAKSNCASTMITGGSNFNVAKHEKANVRERKAYEEFSEWRSKAMTAIVKNAQPEKTYESEILKYKAELEEVIAIHEKTKEANKVISKARKTKENIDKYLIDNFDIKPHMLEWTMKYGFSTTHSNAKIKRLEEKINILETKEIVKGLTGGSEIIFEDSEIKVLKNFELDRVQILTPKKPSSEITSLFKKYNFKWAPSNQVWQRQLTGNAIFAVNFIIKELKK